MKKRQTEKEIEGERGRERAKKCARKKTERRQRWKKDRMVRMEREEIDQKKQEQKKKTEEKRTIRGEEREKGVESSMELAQFNQPDY